MNKNHKYKLHDFLKHLTTRFEFQLHLFLDERSGASS